MTVGTSVHVNSGRHRADPLEHYWTLPLSALLAQVGSGFEGLSEEAAATRLRWVGRNEIQDSSQRSRLRILWNQIRSPLLLLLIIAAVVSALSGEWPDALIVLSMVLLTVGIGYQREHGAEKAAAALRARVKTHCSVLRDGKARAIALEEVVPGDVVLLVAGSVVPADAVILEATDCYVSEAALTGESFPVPKAPGQHPVATPLAQRRNCVFLGTHVRSGTARCVVVATGQATHFGSIARRLSLARPETEFDRALNRLGTTLTSAMLLMVLLVFAAHMLQGRPAIETLLFAIALAVGLSPELLPVILNVNLARAASAMAARGVLVRRLGAIENLGSMDILCTDKTGTLTTGVVALSGAYDTDGQAADRVLELAAINAALETGIPSPLDDAILASHAPTLSLWGKRAEIPFDFSRKRVSIVVQGSGGMQLIAKGEFDHILEVCSTLSDGSALDESARIRLLEQKQHWNRQGIRVLAVASRRLESQAAYTRADEAEMTLQGFLTFLDPPKEGVAEALTGLAKLGVNVKIITGDSKGVAQFVAHEVGLCDGDVLTGADIDQLSDDALWQASEQTRVFAEVDPNQKERLIRAMRRMGHVVGFLGDGINDVQAMRVADTSLSVDQAVDVAREAADFVLLERDLQVIRQGVESGRCTFANTLKYLLTTASANLGNMISMALASLFLPFLPLLAGQILLNNFLSDLPALGMSSDHVDPELVERPRRWNTRVVVRFMVAFGLLSSVFDFLTFGLLISVFQATPELFRTGWFIESLLTELVIALVVRTQRPFFKSRPGRLLFWLSQGVIAIAFILPYTPISAALGFVAPPLSLLAWIVSLTAVYVLAAEALKAWFSRRHPHLS